MHEELGLWLSVTVLSSKREALGSIPTIKKRGGKISLRYIPGN